jgi:predicted dehydrogenase
MGCGHILNLARVPDAELTAVADPHPRSQEWARRLAGRDIEVFSDYHDMLERATFDAVIVATPNMSHAGILKDLLETGKHILCEKPLCTTLEDCRWVVAAAEGHPALCWVGMEMRYCPPVTRFIEEVRGGAAGTVRMLFFREHRFPFLKKVGDWNRFNRNTGGTLVEKSCHLFDLMRLVLRQEPVRVYASGGQDVNHLDELYDGERPDILDNAFVTVDFDGGARAVHDLCMFAEASRHGLEITATGDRGKVECLMPEGEIVLGTRNPRSLERSIVSVPQEALFPGSHDGAVYYQLLAFQRALREGAPAEVSARDGMIAVAVGLAAQRSIEERRVVALSEFGL